MSSRNTAIFLNDRGRHSDPLAEMPLPMKSVNLRLKCGHNPVENNDGDVLAFVLSEDGFTTDASRLRFPVDVCNRESQLYRGESGDALHPDTPLNIKLQSRYCPFSGSTHLYKAVQDALDRLALESSGRPVVVAMTDGEDNGPGDEDDAIRLAKSYGILIYIVGMDSDRAADDLFRVAMKPVVRTST